VDISAYSGVAGYTYTLIRLAKFIYFYIVFFRKVKW